jgi:hypothetical protein
MIRTEVIGVHQGISIIEMAVFPVDIRGLYGNFPSFLPE